MYTELLQLKSFRYSLKYFTFKLLSISMIHETFLKPTLNSFIVSHAAKINWYPHSTFRVLQGTLQNSIVLTLSFSQIDVFQAVNQTIEVRNE